MDQLKGLANKFASGSGSTNNANAGAAPAGGDPAATGAAPAGGAAAPAGEKEDYGDKGKCLASRRRCGG